jgi:hypothetical protein
MQLPSTDEIMPPACRRSEPKRSATRGSRLFETALAGTGAPIWGLPGPARSRPDDWRPRILAARRGYGQDELANGSEGGLGENLSYRARKSRTRAAAANEFDLVDDAEADEEAVKADPARQRLQTLTRAAIDRGDEMMPGMRQPMKTRLNIYLCQASTRK